MPKTPDDTAFADFEVVSPGGKSTKATKPTQAARDSDPAGARVQDPLFALIAKIMDSLVRIPGTNLWVGLDPLIGLIPGFGDSSSALISALLILRGAQAGVPRIVLVRMALNVLINAGVGTIPVLGDAFSVWFRSNRMNYELFERHAGQPGTSKKADWLFVGALLGGLMLLIGLIITVSLTVLAALWHLAFGTHV